MTDQEHFQVVEINGIKMAVDMRQARVVHENIKIGSPVKVLAKSSYSAPEVYQGVVVAFAAFKELPTITVAYVKSSYSNAELLFAHINESTTDKWALVPCVDDELPISKSDMIETFGRDIAKKHQEIRDLEQKRAYFLKHFDQFFVREPVEA